MATYDHEESIIECHKPTASKLVSRAFILGFFFHMLISLFFQDWLGKEEFLKRVSDGWMNIHWSVWIIPIAITLFGFGKTKSEAGDI